MNWDQIKGNWKQFKGQAQKAWGDLTDDDLDKIKGERTRLVGKIQERYGLEKQEAERRVDDWVAKVGDAGDKSDRAARAPR